MKSYVTGTKNDALSDVEEKLARHLLTSSIIIPATYMNVRNGGMVAGSVKDQTHSDPRLHLSRHIEH